MTRPNLRERARSFLLSDIWRSLALVLGLVQVQILHWALVVGRGEGLGLGWIVLFSVGAMGGNVLLMPLIRVAGRAQGLRRVMARSYMNLGIATLLMGLAVVASCSWLWQKNSSPSRSPLVASTTSVRNAVIQATSLVSSVTPCQGPSIE